MQNDPVCGIPIEGKRNNMGYADLEIPYHFCSYAILKYNVKLNSVLLSSSNKHNYVKLDGYDGHF
jgi:hypothetical protein